MKGKWSLGKGEPAKAAADWLKRTPALSEKNICRLRKIKGEETYGESSRAVSRNLGGVGGGGW